MQVSDLVTRMMGAAAEADPAAAVKREMEALSGERDAVAEALAYLTGTGGNALQAFYRAPNLSMLKVAFPNGRRTPPHNHGTWACILLLSGGEKNTIYARGPGGGLSREREVVLKPGSVVLIPAGAVHVAEGLGSEPAIGLHVYGGNVLGLDRQMWDPETLEELPLDWSQYEPLARKATAMAAAPLS